jgi:hypothetical protein
VPVHGILTALIYCTSVLRILIFPNEKLQEKVIMKWTITLTMGGSGVIAVITRFIIPVKNTVFHLCKFG